MRNKCIIHFSPFKPELVPDILRNNLYLLVRQVGFQVIENRCLDIQLKGLVNGFQETFLETLADVCFQGLLNN